jgi:hypothetical protein
MNLGARAAAFAQRPDALTHRGSMAGAFGARSGRGAGPAAWAARVGRGGGNSEG